MFTSAGGNGAYQTISAAGDESNFGLSLLPKGTSDVLIGQNNLSFYSGDSGTTASSQIKLWNGYNSAYYAVLQFNPVNYTSAYLRISSSSGNNSYPTIEAFGSETNNGISLLPKGAGNVNIAKNNLEFFSGEAGVTASPFIKAWNANNSTYYNVLNINPVNYSDSWLTVTNSSGNNSTVTYGVDGYSANYNINIQPKGSGKVGIGGAPSYMLDVFNGQTRIEVSTQYSQRLCHSGSDSSSAQNVVLGDCSTGGNDIAEYYGTTDASIKAADIVSIDPSKPVQTYDHETKGYVSKAWVKKATINDYNGAIGVVSTNPFLEVLADNLFSAAENPRPVALSGRVPVKVNASNGSIAVGDLITVSTTAGVGAKAVTNGFVVGKALQEYSNADTSAVGVIEIFVNLSYYNPQTALDASGSPTDWTREGSIMTTTYSVHITGELTAETGTFSSIYTEILNINNGKLTIDANGKLVTQSEIKAAGVVTAVLQATTATIETLTVEKLNVTEVSIKQTSQTGDATAGTGVIPAGEKSVVILNKKVTANSLIFVTVTSKGGALLSVTTKTPGISFEVEIPSAATQDVTFNYWIVTE